MGNKIQKWISADAEAVKAKQQKKAFEEANINYDEPVARCLCCYFFRTRPLKATEGTTEDAGGGGSVKGKGEEADPVVEAAAEAKAKKMAQILYFQEDIDTKRRKNVAFMKMLEVKDRQAVPMVLRMYTCGRPAPLEFTARCMRLEARLALCTSLENFLK